MLKYYLYFKTSFRQVTTYKADLFIYIVFNMVFFFIFFALWKTIYTDGAIGNINSYSLKNTITYYFVTALIYRFDISSSIYLGNEIWNGYFTNDLTKPWDARIVHALYSLSEVLMRILLYIPFMIFIYFVARNYIDLPTPANTFFFLVTVLLGVLLNLVVNFILHSMTFYFGDVESTTELLNYIFNFLAGGTFPLIFLPESLKWLFYALPFRFLFDTPANIYLGRLSTNEILSAWWQMALWIIGFFIIFYLVYSQGIKKYSGTGR